MGGQGAGADTDTNADVDAYFGDTGSVHTEWWLAGREMSMHDLLEQQDVGADGRRLSVLQHLARSSGPVLTEHPTAVAVFASSIVLFVALFVAFGHRGDGRRRRPQTPQ